MVGQATINNNDLFLCYGASLVKGAYKTLLQGLQAKEIVKNTSRIEHGDRIVITEDYPIKIASRELSLSFVIEGKTRSEMLSNRKSFLNDLISSTIIKFNANKLGLGFKFVFREVTEIVDYTNNKFCTIQIKFYEPNPQDRINL